MYEGMEESRRGETGRTKTEKEDEVLTVCSSLCSTQHVPGKHRVGWYVLSQLSEKGEVG